MKLERRNAYFCKSCRKVTLTVDVDEGVTPMFIPCFHCKNEMANSFMYQLPGCLRFDFTNGVNILPADLEWYKPSDQEMSKLSRGEREHVLKGGLLSRKRTNKPAIMFEVKQNP